MITEGKYMVFPDGEVKVWQNGDSFFTVQRLSNKKAIRAGYYDNRRGELRVSMGSLDLKIKSAPQDLELIKPLITNL